MTTAMEDRLLETVARLGPSTPGRIIDESGLLAEGVPINRLYTTLGSLALYRFLDTVQGRRGRIYALHGHALPDPVVPRSRQVEDAIARRGPSTVLEIAEETGLTAEDVRNALHSLERKGYRSDLGRPPRYHAGPRPPRPEHVPTRELVLAPLREGDATVSDLVLATGRAETTVRGALLAMTSEGVVERRGMRGREVLWGLVG